MDTMYISTKGRYALRLMLDLAENSDNEHSIPLKKVAERQGISLKDLEQIITSLCKAGYVKSIRGAQGGYRLVGDPADYTVTMILSLTEGSLAPISCLEDEPNLCSRAEYCPTLFVWEKLYASIKDTLDSITLKDIIENHKSLNNISDYVI